MAPETELSALVGSVVAAHAGRRGPLLPILHDLYSSLGSIPPAAIGLLADELNLSRADVYGVVTQYPDFASPPRPGRRLRVCAAEACQARGSAALAQQLRSYTDVDEVFCLGLCALGPVIEVDGVPHARLTPDNLAALLEVTA